MPQFVSGLDPGKTTDPAALAVCEQIEGDDPLCPGRPCWHYHTVWLHRWPLGTPYATVGDQKGLGEQVSEIFARPPLPGSLCAVDQTGVGGAVIDLLRSLRPPCALVGITITGGASWSSDGMGYHVSKSELVSLLVSLFHSGRLKIAPALALAPALAKELAAFREKQQASGSLAWEADKVSDHDDLVMALSIACWLAERSPPLRAKDIGRGQRTQAHQAPPGTFLPALPQEARDGRRGKQRTKIPRW